MSDEKLFAIYYDLGDSRNLYVLQKALDQRYVEKSLERRFTLLELEAISLKYQWESRINHHDAELRAKVDNDTYDQEIEIRTIFNSKRKVRLDAIDKLRKVGISCIEALVTNAENFRALPIDQQLKFLPALCKAIETAAAEERKELEMADDNKQPSNDLGDILKGFSPAIRKTLSEKLALERSNAA